MPLEPYSVVIPSFNRYLEVLQAARSALAQTVPPELVVIADDASTDDRYGWLEEILNDKRVMVVRSEVNSRERHSCGYAIGAARNVALRVLLSLQTSGWIAFLDDDDEWVPEKMERCFLAARKWDYHRLVSTNAYNRSPDGTVTGYHHGRQGRRLAEVVFDVTEVIRNANPIINSTAVIGLDVAREIGLQRETGYGEDWDYWMRAARLTPALFLDEPLAYYTTGNPKHYGLH